MAIVFGNVNLSNMGTPADVKLDSVTRTVTSPLGCLLIRKRTLDVAVDRPPWLFHHVTCCCD